MQAKSDLDERSHWVHVNSRAGGGKEFLGQALSERGFRAAIWGPLWGTALASVGTQSTTRT